MQCKKQQNTGTNESHFYMLFLYPSLFFIIWSQSEKQRLERQFKGFLADANSIRENILVNSRSAKHYQSLSSTCFITDSIHMRFIP